MIIACEHNMEKITRVEIKEKLNDHGLWLSGDTAQGSQADFSGKLIKIANFKEARLSKSNFSNSTLKIIEFVDADLQNADFENTELIKVDFHGADLNGANFQGANFKKVHICEEMFGQIKEDLTEEQREGVITSYKKFMRKMIF